jgi:16S rRNA (uracil1498-N3)-methyltransferase
MRPPGELDVAALAALSPGRVLVAHHGAEPAPRLPEGALTVVTGPEGGFSPAELARFAEFRAIWWGLGNFVLRAETAPLAAAARLLV